VTGKTKDARGEQEAKHTRAHLNLDGNNREGTVRVHARKKTNIFGQQHFEKLRARDGDENGEVASTAQPGQKTLVGGGRSMSRQGEGGWKSKAMRTAAKVIDGIFILPAPKVAHGGGFVRSEGHD